MADEDSTKCAIRNHKMELARLVLFGYGQPMKIGDRIRARREELDISQDELAAAVGVKQNTVSSWEVGRTDPKREQMPRIATALGLSLSALELGDNAPELRKFSIMGLIGTGEAVEPLEDNARLGEVEAPAWVPENAGVVVVRGRSMRPLYRDGNVLLFWQWAADPTPFVGINEPVVCRLTSGGMLVKMIKEEGSAPGLWTLESINPNWEDLPDQRLESVAPIEMMFRTANWNR